MKYSRCAVPLNPLAVAFRSRLNRLLECLLVVHKKLLLLRVCVCCFSCLLYYYDSWSKQKAATTSKQASKQQQKRETEKKLADFSFTQQKTDFSMLWLLFYVVVWFFFQSIKEFLFVFPRFSFWYRDADVAAEAGRFNFHEIWSSSASDFDFYWWWIIYWLVLRSKDSAQRAMESINQNCCGICGKHDWPLLLLLACLLAINTPNI